MTDLYYEGSVIRRFVGQSKGYNYVIVIVMVVSMAMGTVTVRVNTTRTVTLNCTPRNEVS